jgi:hypothetical protein
MFQTIQSSSFYFRVYIPRSKVRVQHVNDVIKSACVYFNDRIHSLSSAPTDAWGDGKGSPSGSVCSCPGGRVEGQYIMIFQYICQFNHLFYFYFNVISPVPFYNRQRCCRKRMCSFERWYTLESGVAGMIFPLHGIPKRQLQLESFWC